MLKERRLGLFGGGGPVSTLSAPILAYPIPIAGNPTTISVNIGADWISGDVFKLARSASPSMSSPTILAHTTTDTDITNGGFSIGLSGVTLSGITYFEGYGHDVADSPNVSNIVSWGDTTVPTITTSGTQSVYEQVPLAVTLAATDTGGVPALISTQNASGVWSPGWAVVGGVDQLQFQVAIVGGVPTLQWYGNGVQTYNSPANIPPNNANPYHVTVQAVDYGGNAATLAVSVTVNQIVVSFSAPFTNVNNAALSTLYTSNTVTVTITPTGLSVSSSLSGTGFTYSKNGGSYLGPGSFTVQSGDTITLQVMSASSNSVTETGTLAVGSQSQSWSVATPGSAATDTVGNGSTGAGTSKSKYLNVTSFQFVTNAGVGDPCLTRSTLSQANVGWYIEGTINGFGSSGQVIFGVDDGTTDLNAGGTGFLTTVPGQTTIPGFAVKAGSGGTSVTLLRNGASQGMTLPGGNVITVGDTIGIYFNSSTKVVTVYYYSAANGDLGQIGTATLSSLIPSAVWIVQGGQKGNATISTSDTGTTNYGASGYVRTPPVGSTYFA